MFKKEIIQNSIIFIAVFIGALIAVSPFYFLVKDERKVDAIKAQPHPERAEAYKDMFSMCLKNIPKGPEKTHYNDWDEVVDSCSYMARRYVNERFGVLNSSYNGGN